MLRLNEAVTALNARRSGADVAFSGVTTDSRAVAAGDLFVALKGERFDGHDYVAQVIGQGAAAALVDHADPAWGDFPLLVVADTRLALGALANLWRSRFSIPLVGLTGSSGKTSVKEMIAAILRAHAGDEAVLATKGNLNNDIGLPLTLLGLRDKHRYGVIEMGMNHPGEIAYLSKIAQPNAALVINAQAAHLAGMGTIGAVAHAKGEIFEGLAADGIAVINADDQYAALWQKLAAGHRTMRFGLNQPAEISGVCRLLPFCSEIDMATPEGKFTVTLPVPGEHNVRNALAAAAVAVALGVGNAAIAAGLAKVASVKGRMQKSLCLHGATLIDDSYNANPGSVKAAIAVLAALPGKKVLVLGDMGELGANARALHTEIGAAAKAAGIDCLFTLGDLSASAAEAFGKNGRHFEYIEDLLHDIENLLAPEVVVLVKGSRFMQMERVVKSFVPREDSTCCSH